MAENDIGEDKIFNENLIGGAIIKFWGSKQGVNSENNFEILIHFMRLMLGLIFLNIAYLPVSIARKHFKGDRFSVLPEGLNLPVSSTLFYRQIVLITPCMYIFC